MHIPCSQCPALGVWNITIYRELLCSEKRVGPLMSAALEFFLLHQNMRLTQENINNLKNYIEKDEVVYQVCGELVEVSNTDNGDNRKSLLEYFKHVSSVEVYQKGDSFIHDPFEELDNWATDDDVLLLLEIIGVVICIPRKIAVEHNIL